MTKVLKSDVFYRTTNVKTATTLFYKVLFWVNLLNAYLICRQNFTLVANFLFNNIILI